jgi:hypothetical protein
MINWTVVFVPLLSQVLLADGTIAGRIDQRFPSCACLMLTPCASAHATKATNGSFSVRPSGVIEYSTATCDDAITRRFTSPLRSNRRNASVKALCVIRSRRRLIALKRGLRTQYRQYQHRPFVRDLFEHELRAVDCRQLRTNLFDRDFPRRQVLDGQARAGCRVGLRPHVEPAVRAQSLLIDERHDRMSVRKNAI